jgi:hypothetical protein
VINRIKYIFTYATTDHFNEYNKNLTSQKKTILTHFSVYNKLQKTNTLSNDHVTNLSYGHVTTLYNGHVTNLSYGHVTNLSNGHVTHLSNRHVTNLSNGHVTNLSNGHVTNSQMRSEYYKLS